MNHSKPQSGGHAPLETARARSVRPSLMGFTLIELLVSIAIFTIMTGVVLAKYNTYNTNAPFANASEDVVLALRQAQVYGAGTKGNAGCTAATAFECSYGVYFSTNSAEKNGLTIFVDNNNDRVFTSGPDGVVEHVQWASSISISTLLCPGPASATACNITFRRPNPDAFIDDSTPSPVSSYDAATITIADAISGKTALVTISKAGQISLQ